MMIRLPDNTNLMIFAINPNAETVNGAYGFLLVDTNYSHSIIWNYNPDSY